MSQAKIIKLPDGEAFIEIGQDYIRIGTSPDNFILIDKTAVNTSAKSVNYQLSPDKVTYYGFLNHINPIAGFAPIGPVYSISEAPITALVNVMVNSLIIASSIGI